MAYPYYPNYQPYPQVNSMYNPVQTSTTMYNDQRNQTHDERIFVQGRLAAEAYLVAPNSFVRLWDSTESKFYEKRADPTGRPYMETYEYRRCEPQPVNQPVKNVGNTIDYESKIKAIEDRIAKLEGGMRSDSAKSYGNDSAVHAVQAAVPRGPEAGGYEVDAVGPT